MTHKFVFIGFIVLIFLLAFLFHNRAHPKVLEIIVTFIAGIIILLALWLQPEKYNVIFPSSYFFDLEKSKLVDFKTPGLHFIEDTSILPYSKEILKNNLKDYVLVARDLCESSILKMFALTPFGYEEYIPFSRITHLWFGSCGGPRRDKYLTPSIPGKKISGKDLIELTKGNIFSEVIINHPFGLSIKEIIIPPHAILIIERPNEHQFSIKIYEPFWFDLKINVTQGGSMLGNRVWGNQFLDLGENGLTLIKNDKIVETFGTIEINWNISRWSIGNPNMEFRKKWLRAITDRIINYLDWDKKVQLLHIEMAPYNSGIQNSR